jgi:hypothetical protein
MNYKVEFITYNNTDFKNHVFCESMQEAKELVRGLQKLKHVTNVSVQRDDSIDGCIINGHYGCKTCKYSHGDDDTKCYHPNLYKNPIEETFYEPAVDGKEHGQ